MAITTFGEPMEASEVFNRGTSRTPLDESASRSEVVIESVITVGEDRHDWFQVLSGVTNDDTRIAPNGENQDGPEDVFEESRRTRRR